MQIEHSVLANGLRVYTAVMPGFSSAAVAAFVSAGSRNETAANGGIAHFLEHMAFKGTASRSALQIATEIEVLGANINAYTSKDTTAYFVTGLNTTIAESVTILGDVLTASRFDPDDVATERGVILQEIRRHFDNPGAVASDGFARTAFPDQALGRPILGAAEFIERVERDDLTDFVGRHYHPRNMVVVGTGDIEHAAFRDLVEAHFGAMPDGPTPEPAAAASYVGGVVTDRGRDFQQVTLLLGLPSVAQTHPDSHAHGLLASAIGGGMSSPLFQEVREKRGLVYAVQAGSEHSSDYGVLSVYAGTTPEHVAEVIALSCEQIVRATRGVEAQDLERARNSALVHLATSKERPFQVARGIAWSLFTYGRVITPEEFMEKVAAITMDDVRHAAETVLRGTPTLSLVGPVPDADYAGMLKAALPV
jgi:predicted Zn-dependent peptidase